MDGQPALARMETVQRMMDGCPDFFSGHLAQKEETAGIRVARQQDPIRARAEQVKRGMLERVIAPSVQDGRLIKQA